MIEELRHLLDGGLPARQSGKRSLSMPARFRSTGRYVYLNGAPRSYERLVHDRGDGVFGSERAQA